MTQFCRTGDITVVLHGPPGAPPIWALADEKPESKATEAVVAIENVIGRLLVTLSLVH
jgi:hypothetical protein